jgi:2-phosphosulfolactate phosphatase
VTFEVCFLPTEATRRPPPVAVLIDVIRATTTVVTLFDGGCSDVWLARRAGRARLAELRAHLGRALVCAEDRSGGKAADADLTPSPAALHGLDLKGQRVILSTTNGTLAADLLHQTGVEHVLLGSMRNGAAVMAAAVALARQLDRSISLVCAGREECRIPALDDAYCAAALLRHGEDLVQLAGETVTLTESARIARHAAMVFAGPREAYDQSTSAGVVRRIGAPDDVDYCAEVDVSRVVPVVTFDADTPAIVVRRLEEDIR